MVHVLWNIICLHASLPAGFCDQLTPEPSHMHTGLQSRTHHRADKMSLCNVHEFSSLKPSFSEGSVLSQLKQFVNQYFDAAG